MGQSSQDRFARRLAIASLTISGLAIAVPYLQQRYQFQAQQEENVALFPSQSLVAEFIPLQNTLKTGGKILQVSFPTTMSNNGNRKVSVVQIRTSTNAGGIPSSYIGQQGDLVDERGKEIALPIVIDAGESRVFRLYLGFVVPDNVHRIASDLYKKGQDTQLDLDAALSKNQLDIYGQSVKYEASDGGGYHIRWPKESQNYQRIQVSFATSRGNVFQMLVNAYGF